MILSIAEATYAVDSTDLDEIKRIACGLSVSLRRNCNRIFADRLETGVGAITATGSLVTATVYGHGMRIGDSVRIATSTRDSDLDGDFVLTAVTRDTFSFASTVAQVDANAITYATSRPIWVSLERTDGRASIFVDWGPIEEVTKLEVKAGSSWSEVDASDYVVVGGSNNGYSKACEISLLSSCFPAGPQGEKFHPEGARVTYVAGEPEAPPDAIYMATELLKKAKSRSEESEFQSESLEDESRTRWSRAEIGQLFGEADRIMQELRISP